MKYIIYRIYTFLIILFLLTAKICFTQKVDPLIKGRISSFDPRKYIALFVENENNRELWKPKELSTTSYVLKREIDANSLIYVHFEQESLKVADIYYNISVGAKLNDRKIELSPFSEVGEKQKIINDGRPTKEIGNNYISLKNCFKQIIELSRIYVQLEKEIKDKKDIGVISTEIFNSNIKNLKASILLLKNVTLTDTTIKNLNYISNIKNNIINSSKNIFSFLPDGGNQLKMYLSYLELNNDPNNFINEFQNHIDGLTFSSNVDDLSLVRQKLLRQLNSEYELAISLNDYFNGNGKQTNFIFNSLIDFNNINLKKLFDEVKLISQIINSLKLDSPDFKDSVLNVNSLILNDKVTIISDYINKFIQLLPEIINIDEKIKELIYSNYFYGTIDLKKSTALEGDQLYIYLLLTDPLDPNSKPIELQVAVFEITSLGWKIFKVSDSFNLIHSNYNTNDSSESFIASNYKPVPGVSLLSSYAGKEKNDFWNVLYPSIGINLSYLDFYSNKDVEIGIGLIAGLFNNKLFFNIGYNLQASKNKSLYWGLGFSFVNLLNTFVKPNNSVGSAN